MTVHLNLPKDLEDRFMAEVRAGRHRSVEDAILEKLSRQEDPDLLTATGMSASQLRNDLDDAWNNRAGAVDADVVFKRLADKSAALRSEGK